MNKIQSFKNAQEFQELFGIQEHGNGVKSHRNQLGCCVVIKNLQNFYIVPERLHVELLQERISMLLPW